MITTRFDEKIQQFLKFYVYMLLDPRDDAVFYVGKGQKNRIFDHIERAITDSDSDSLKYARINEIIKAQKMPQHIILRHGLTEREALHIEAAMLDYLRFSETNLTNLQAGHGTVVNGLMSTQEVIDRYSAEPLTEIGPECVIININRSYERFSEQDAIYNATKEVWRMRDPINAGIHHVLSEYHGLIVEVFEVDEWYTKERQYGPGAKKKGETYKGWGFNGHVADSSIRNRYRNKSIRHLKKRGGANVIRYKLND